MYLCYYWVGDPNSEEDNQIGKRNGGPSAGGLGQSVAMPIGLWPAAQGRLGVRGLRPPLYVSFPTQFRVSPL